MAAWEYWQCFGREGTLNIESLLPIDPGFIVNILSHSTIYYISNPIKNAGVIIGLVLAPSFWWVKSIHGPVN